MISISGDAGLETDCTEAGEELPDDITTGDSRDPEPLTRELMTGCLAGEGGTLFTLVTAPGGGVVSGVLLVTGGEAGIDLAPDCWTGFAPAPGLECGGRRGLCCELLLWTRG